MKGIKRSAIAVFCFLMAAGLIFNSKAETATRLKAPVPDLCYGCHEKLKTALSDKYVHALFKKGECLTCHNSHVSSEAGLLQDRIGNICMNCHDNIKKIIDKGHVHKALRKYDCTVCHDPHSSNNNHLLVSGEKKLCVTCHPETSEQAGLPYGCLPFKKGECSACHESHASSGANLLKSKPEKLCSECHAPGCKAGDVPIADVVKDMDCTSCHSGHGSKNKGALGPFGHRAFINGECGKCHAPIVPDGPITVRIENEDLCFSCHDRNEYKYTKDDDHKTNLTNPCNLCHGNHASDTANLTVNETGTCIECHEKTERKTAEMEKKLKTTECTPVRDRKCFECHVPGHSERPLSYTGDGVGMCARCHENEHSSTHPVGNDIIDPRNGQPVTCISCHSMHASRADYMLTHDRNRSLCIQCHKQK